MLIRKITVLHAKAMDMTCCNNNVPFPSGVIQTIASPQSLPPITLKTKPLEQVKVPMTDASVVAPAQEAALVIIMTAEIVAI